MIRIDASQLEDVEKRLGSFREKAPAVLARALNRVATNARANASKKVRENYTLKAKDVNETFTVRRASPSKLASAVTSRSQGVGLDKFKVSPLEPRQRKPVRGGLKVQVKKTGSVKRFLSAFIASVNGNKVFQREGGAAHRQRADGQSTQLPIKRLFGPPVPEMLDNRTIRQYVEEEAEITFEKRLDHEIKRVLQLGGGRS